MKQCHIFLTLTYNAGMLTEPHCPPVVTAGIDFNCHHSVFVLFCQMLNISLSAARKMGKIIVLTVFVSCESNRLGRTFWITLEYSKNN